MTEDAKKYAKVECIAIPDGIHLRGGQHLLRVSLVLRPEPTDEPSAVSLLDWPNIIPTLSFQVSFGSEVKDLKPLPSNPVPEYESQERLMSAEATNWWSNELWGDPEVFADYVELMRSPGFQAPAVGFSSYSFLADMARSRVEGDIEMGLLAALYRTRAELKELKSLHSNAVSRLEDPADPATILADIQELVAREVFADIPIGDAVGTLVARAAEPGYQSGLGAGLMTKKIDEAMQACFDQSENAILGRDGATGGAEPGKWNPFTLNPPAAVRSSSDFLGDRYEASIFGSRIEVPEPGTLAGQANQNAGKSFAFSNARLALAAFDQMMSTATAETATTGSADTLERVALHHVAGLQAHPALRKFVRLIVDIPVPLESIPASLVSTRKGVVSVSAMGPAAATRKTATAFVLDVEHSLFEPCPEASFYRKNLTSRVPSLPLDNGVVALNIGRQDKVGKEARFRMDVVDATAGILSLRHQIQTALHASRKGLSANQASGEHASLRTRGLMLIDTEANVPAVMAREIAAQERAANAAITLYFAERLVDGYRPDAVRTVPNPDHSAPTVEVFPIAARSLSYGVIEAALTKTRLAPSTYDDTADRNEGYISPGSRIVAKTDEPQRQFTSEQLFCWTGDNLGLPTPTNNHESLTHRLPTKITCGFKPAYKGPILRVGGQYRYMLRARKLNGSSVPTSFSKLLADKHACGDSSGQGYVFMPVERTPAPTVLVPADQRLARDDQTEDQPSSQVVLLNPDEVATRILVSPRIEFDLAEQQGQFDPIRGKGEDIGSALSRANRYKDGGTYQRLKREDENGNYPPYTGTTSAGDGRYSALLFEVLKAPVTSFKRPYYVDRSLCVLGSNLSAVKATTRHAIENSFAEGVSFWNRSVADKDTKGQGFAPEKIRPVQLEFVSVRSGKSGVFNAGERLMHCNGQYISVSVMRVEVAPGDTLSLDVWLNRTAEFSLNQPLLLNAWNRLSKRLKMDTPITLEDLDNLHSKDAANKENWWSKLTCNTRIPALHEVVNFRIEHVVSIPLEPPKFLQAFGCTRANDAQEWADHCALRPQHADRPNASTVFSWGAISIDRKTTEAVWAEAIWSEVDPALARQRTTAYEEAMEIDQNGLWTYRPSVGQGRLFDIQNIPALATQEAEDPAAYAARADRLDLLRDDVGELRNLAADFKSHKARRILVRLLARSRFVAPSIDLSDPTNTSASATRGDFFAALEGGPCPTGVEEIWLPATRPPAPPRLMKDQGSLYQRRFDPLTTDLAVGHRGKRLTHIYRCWLDSDWFSSGEGEKLAVVCRDPSQGDQPDWLLAKVSRWGGDMTMRPPVYLKPAPTSIEAPTFLDPRQIVGMTPEVGELTSISKDEKGNVVTSVEGVRLALLEPAFHTGTGRWYCDIELVPAGSFRVCLRLSLARFQANAIDGCHLSDTVLADAFMLHQPWSFSAARKDGVVEIIATGPAYTQRAPMVQGLKHGEAAQDVEAQAAEPLVVVELERLDPSGGGPLPVMSSQGQRATTNSRQAIRREQDWPKTAIGIEKGWTRWVMQLAIPRDEVGYRHAVRITLASAHANSTATQADDIDGALIYLPEPLVVQLEI
ncbi:hypothetical protein DBR45_21375 [Pseudomonas sp. HMWF031]|nr:hypothetical protein DBR45_21375 [Pseudomonas sp. HMWF031]